MKQSNSFQLRRISWEVEVILIPSCEWVCGTNQFCCFSSEIEVNLNRCDHLRRSHQLSLAITKATDTTHARRHNRYAATAILIISARLAARACPQQTRIRRSITTHTRPAKSTLAGPQWVHSYRRKGERIIMFAINKWWRYCRYRCYF